MEGHLDVARPDRRAPRRRRCRPPRRRGGGGRGPVEPMYIPGRSRTGSRPSRTVMSLAVGGLGHEKSPANSLFAGRLQSIRNAGRQRVSRRPLRGSPRPLARPAGAAPRPRSRPRVRRPRHRSSAVGSRPPCRPGGLPGAGLGQRSRRERGARGAASPSSARSCARIVSASRPSSKAQVDEAVLTCSFPPRRSAPATRSGPRSRRRRRPGTRDRRKSPSTGPNGRARGAPRVTSRSITGPSPGPA